MSQLSLRNDWFKLQDFTQTVDHFRRICRTYLKIYEDYPIAMLRFQVQVVEILLFWSVLCRSFSRHVKWVSWHVNSWLDTRRHIITHNWWQCHGLTRCLAISCCGHPIPTTIVEGLLASIKVEPPKINNDRKTNTMYHMHTLGASKCMHVVHSVGFVIAVGFGWFYLTCFAREVSSQHWTMCS